MKWIEAKVVFDSEDQNLAADLISDTFYDFGLQGVVVEDPDLEPVEDWAEDSLARPTHYAVIGYFAKDHQVEQRCKILTQKLIRLKNNIRLKFRISYKELDDEDWAESWKAFFWPQKISEHIVVKPTWREYKAEPAEIVLELDPGMAFGTGTHPTTALCVELIEEYVKKGDAVLDVGTGSGILMIAAAKLGAERICGTDRDEVAVEVAHKNLNLNRIDPRSFTVKIGDLVHDIKEKYDLVVANILTHVILELLPNLKNVLKKKGVFICSGIVEENKNLVIGAMRNAGFEMMEVRKKEEWVAIAGRRRDQVRRKAS